MAGPKKPPAFRPQKPIAMVHPHAGKQVKLRPLHNVKKCPMGMNPVGGKHSY